VAIVAMVAVRPRIVAMVAVRPRREAARRDATDVVGYHHHG
jgi:hypothetical protein